VWHAVRAFCWAVFLPAAELRDFYAIAVYFASITMWAYAYLANSASRTIFERLKTSRGLSDSHNGHLFVILNGPETREIHTFITGSQGAPTLMPLTPRLTLGISGTRSDAFVILSDPNAALKMTRDLYGNNSLVVEKPLPVLVESLGFWNIR
jgi:hypothetical protein